MLYQPWLRVLPSVHTQRAIWKLRWLIKQNVIFNEIILIEIASDISSYLQRKDSMFVCLFYVGHWKQHDQKMLTYGNGNILWYNWIIKYFQTWFVAILDSFVSERLEVREFSAARRAMLESLELINNSILSILWYKKNHKYCCFKSCCQSSVKSWRLSCTVNLCKIFSHLFLLSCCQIYQSLVKLPCHSPVSTL